MPAADPGDVSQLLLAWSEGDSTALERLTPIVYEELRRIARQHMQKEQAGHTLQATALVHEAYAKLVDCSRMKWQNRAHFFAMSSQLMRRILIDYARRYNRKRGADLQRISLVDVAQIGQDFALDFLALNTALEELSRIDERKARIVEMRFFGGLSVEETAEALQIASITVIRDWNLAKAWLYRRISGNAPE